MLRRVKPTQGETIGEILRLIRTSNELTIKQISEQTGIAPSTISRIETDRRHPSIETYFKLLDALGADIYIMH